MSSQIGVVPSSISSICVFSRRFPRSTSSSLTLLHRRFLHRKRERNADTRTHVVLTYSPFLHHLRSDFGRLGPCAHHVRAPETCVLVARVECLETLAVLVIGDALRETRRRRDARAV